MNNIIVAFAIKCLIILLGIVIANKIVCILKISLKDFQELKSTDHNSEKLMFDLCLLVVACIAILYITKQKISLLVMLYYFSMGYLLLYVKLMPMLSIVYPMLNLITLIFFLLFFTQYQIFDYSPLDLILSILVSCFIVVLMYSSIIFTGFFLSDEKKEKCIENIMNKRKVEKIRSSLKYPSKKSKVSILITQLIVLIISIIYLFCNVYYVLIILNDRFGLDNSLVYSGTNSSISKFDCLYFSSTTFFTVGYGDIVPQGLLMKLIVQFEMVVAYITGVIYIAIILLFIHRRINYSIDKTTIGKQG